MLGIKKQLIKNYLNIKVVENKEGSLTIKVNHLSELQDEYKMYEKEIIELIKETTQISDVILNTQSEYITFIYNPAQTSPAQIVKWINMVVNTGIDQIDFISKYWEKDPEYVINRLKEIFKTKSQGIFGSSN